MEPAHDHCECDQVVLYRVQEHLMGGDCLNVGCVPSKALIRAARAAYEARNASEFGISCGEVTVDFGKVCPCA